MKKQLHGGVVTGILIVVGLFVVVLAWRAVAPPSPAGLKSFDKASLAEMTQKHAASANDIRNEQKRLLQQTRGQ